MTKRCFKILSVAAMALMVSWSCCAQVYSQSIGSFSVDPSRVTYAEAIWWHAGTPPLDFQLSEYGYSLDKHGKIINPRTRVYIGSLTFTLPLRPHAVAVCGGFILMLLILMMSVWTIFRWRRQEKQVSYPMAYRWSSSPRQTGRGKR